MENLQTFRSPLQGLVSDEATAQLARLLNAMTTQRARCITEGQGQAHHEFLAVTVPLSRNLRKLLCQRDAGPSFVGILDRLAVALMVNLIGRTWDGWNSNCFGFCDPEYASDLPVSPLLMRELRQQLSADGLARVSRQSGNPECLEALELLTAEEGPDFSTFGEMQSAYQALQRSLLANRKQRIDALMEKVKGLLAPAEYALLQSRVI